MIWFFLAGFISGAVGMVMYSHYWIRKHTTVVKLPPMDKKEEEKSHE